MSVHITSAVWQESTATGAKLLVLLSLADQASDDGRCWPSIENIAARCRISESSARRYVQALIEAGELIKEDRPGRSSRYTVTLGRRGVNLTPLQSDTPVKAVTGGGVTADTQKRKETSTDSLTFDDAWGKLTDLARSKVDVKIEEEFAQWYAAYPRHDARGDGLKAYRAARKKVDASILLEGAHFARRRWPEKNGGPFCPLPASWLRAERWADEGNVAAAADNSGEWS